MTSNAAARLPAFGDGGPVARIMRRYLVRASLTLLAVVILTAFLLPLVSMLTIALEDPGQRATPGAPIYPASPAMLMSMKLPIPHSPMSVRAG